MELNCAKIKDYRAESLKVLIELLLTQDFVVVKQITDLLKLNSRFLLNFPFHVDPDLVNGQEVKILEAVVKESTDLHVLINLKGTLASFNES